MKRQQGVSLPEMLVALVSSSLLILTIMNQYLGTKRHYQLAAHRLETALDLQLVSDLIRDSTRQAGFTPCLGMDHLTTIDTRNHQRGLAAIELQSGNGEGFQINHMSAHYGLLIHQTSQTSWTATQESSLVRQLPVLISDCYHAEVHTIETIRVVNGRSEIKLAQAMVYAYVPPIYIGEWLEERFFVRPGALFYQLHHADALSSAVKDWTVSLKSQHGQRLVQVALAFEDVQPVQLDTMLRIV